MKTHLCKPLLILAVCAATALPVAAAPREESRNTKTTATKSTSDRRIDFGKPVRFVKNTFTRDNDSQSNQAMNQSQRQKEDDKSRFWNRDEDKDRSWSRDKMKDNNRTMKKNENPGFVDRMLSWRPFNRDKDR